MTDRITERICPDGFGQQHGNARKESGGCLTIVRMNAHAVQNLQNSRIINKQCIAASFLPLTEIGRC